MNFKQLFNLLLFLLNLHSIAGHFNILLDSTEVKKLMGLDTELYYVKNGIVNNYAVGYVLTVNNTIEELEFTWQNLAQQALHYKISIEYNLTQNALAPPSLSIPSKGFLPFSKRTFSLHLHCFGNVSQQVDMQVHFTIVGSTDEGEVNFSVKRNKICLEHGLKLKDVALSQTTKTIKLNHEDDSSAFVAATFTFFITMTLALAAGISYFRNKKRSYMSSPTTFRATYANAGYNGPQSVIIKLDPNFRPSSVASGSYATIASLNKYQMPDITKTTYSWFRGPSPYATTNLNGEYQEPHLYDKAESVASSKISYYASSQVTQVCTLSTPSKSLHSRASHNKKLNTDKLKAMAVASDLIETDILLHQGTYGRIFRGNLHEGVGQLRPALVKTVVENATLTQVSFLLADASLLADMQHPNLLFPIAAFADLSGPPKVAYDLPKDNLKSYLTNYRDGIHIANGIPLNTRQLVDIALHITRGLLHMHNNNLLHGDIATRNCWITIGANVCIGDNALAKDLFSAEYHCTGDNENRPIKWMSLEALERRQVTTASDVWQLGVLFWELATLATIPYEEVDAFELLPYLSDGFRLTQPKNCPDKFFRIMSSCWSADPDYRPTLIQMLTYLHELFDDLGKYI
ncbi:tyrosine-protein kinase RYK [Culicoides brevitarsis]|uniref:tyrosine-protein kinase RYK n=1 Tax=Culicoides brevitarsis TaxID=469753 RepID=UPI00307B342A